MFLNVLNKELLIPGSGFLAREALKSWQERNIKWLEFSDVYSETSNNVRITVIPFFIGIKVIFFLLNKIELKVKTIENYLLIKERQYWVYLLKNILAFLKSFYRFVLTLIVEIFD